ncbi:MAG: LVIVD repeat-containing protein [Longimicrobiales bacterium]
MSNVRMSVRSVALAIGVLAFASCASSQREVPATPVAARVEAAPAPSPTPSRTASSDPRVGLEAGMFDAETAIWNLRLLSTTPAREPFAGVTNSDLAFMDHYAIQGNYNGFQVWDISNPSSPTLRKGYFCPASQSDVSVYRNLLFVSGEGLSGRIDCGGQGVDDAVSEERLRGIRIFDISDLDNPVNVGNVQTCRGSHTHTVLVDPDDQENVYVYISGSSRIRPDEELAGCSGGMPGENPNTALFRIEVIKVPVAHPEQAAIVSSPRIFEGLEAPPEHGEAPADIAEREAEVAEARRTGGFVVTIEGREEVLSSRYVASLLEEIVAARGGSGAPTAADSATLRRELPNIIARMFADDRPETGPTQCHDITVYPAIGLAGGACGGYGLLLDISDPVRPRRIDAVADSNFSYWHSATFNNAGTKVLFTDEWGGGGGAKCRATDPEEWGADAIFTLEGDRMAFHSYYKLPAPQTPVENCVAHNGSLIPIPGRDVMVQGWYQGGISVFDWTDPENPVEIAFFDRGPVDAERMESGGSWSVYWYNGVIVNSEIARGLDILQLTPSAFLTQNEIDAARTVHLDYFNVQGQQQFVWPPSFSLARAYLDQLERSNGMSAAQIQAARDALAAAERTSGDERRDTLTTLVAQLRDAAERARDQAKVRTLATAVAELADAEG